MYIIKVHLGRELLVGRAGEEVQAAIAAEHRAAKLDNRRNRRVAEYIVKTGAAGHFAQLCRRIFHLAGVDKVQLDAVLLLDLGRREQRLGACQTVLVHIGHNDHGRTDVTVQRIRQRTQTHRTGTCHDGQLAALFNTHFVVINTHLGVISGVERTDRAAHRLSKRRLVVGTPLVLEQAAKFHNLSRNDAVGRIAAEELVGIAGAPHRALVVERRLQRELHARLELILMLRANLDDIARKLVTHDGRMLGNIRMHALVLGTKDGALVGGHTDAVGYDLDQNLIIADFRQLKGIQTQIIRSMQTYSPCFHNNNSPLSLRQ